jgi:hypothetical protein
VTSANSAAARAADPPVDSKLLFCAVSHF